MTVIAVIIVIQLPDHQSCISDICRVLEISEHELITGYAFAPAILCTVICALRLDDFLKAGACTALSTVMYTFTDYVVAVLFGTNENSYQVNFNDWSQCLEGNIYLIASTAFLLMSAVFTGVGIYRIRKNRKSQV